MADVNLSRSALINYTLVRGDTFAPPPVAFEINGDPEDFSGAVLTMQVRDSGRNVVKELTGDDGITVNGNALQYAISAGDMAILDPGCYTYDVQKAIAGTISTIQHGKILLNPDVTR